MGEFTLHSRPAPVVELQKIDFLKTNLLPNVFSQLGCAPGGLFADAEASQKLVAAITKVWESFQQC
jgi:hypothetical protein